MKKSMFAAAVLVVLVGCRNQDGAVPDASAASTPEAASSTGTLEPTPAPAPLSPSVAPDPGTPCTGEPGCGDLPPGVTIAAAHELRSGRIYTSAQGTNRRQLAFEIMDAELPAVLEAFKRSMTDAGFSSNDTIERPNGVLSIQFNKKGYGVVNSWVNPSLGPRPKNPNSKGVLGVDMPEDGQMPAVDTN